MNETTERCACGRELERCSYSDGCPIKTANDVKRLFVKAERERKRRLKEDRAALSGGQEREGIRAMAVSEVPSWEDIIKKLDDLIELTAECAKHTRELRQVIERWERETRESRDDS